VIFINYLPLNQPVTTIANPQLTHYYFSAAEASQTDGLCETFNYSLTITNTAIIPDTFVQSIEGNGWEVGLPDDITLDAGESTEFSVDVTIPESAEDNEFDTVSVIATSIGDESEFAELELTTTTVVPEPDSYDLFMPLIIKQ